jgi:hypothetical protein
VEGLHSAGIDSLNGDQSAIAALWAYPFASSYFPAQN